MIVSLDDQLEWQESSKSHSPRTPTAPEILKSLRKNSPPPTPSRDSQSLQSSEALGELSTLSGFEALEKLRDVSALKSSKTIGDNLCFSDGSTLSLGAILPLQVRSVSRDDSVTDLLTEIVSPLTVGAAWLSVVAEHTYDSQLASLLRSRKGIAEIVLDDRRILNRYLSCNLSLSGLKASRLWTGVVDEDVRASGSVDLDSDSSDPISIRTKRRSQLSLLEERKAMLVDQQTRLRRLLARELQRLHSGKTASIPAQQTPAVASSVAPSTVAPVLQNGPNVSNAVANMLKKFKPRITAPVDGASAPAQIIPGTSAPIRLVSHPVQPDEVYLLREKLRCLHVEWYRVGSRLRSSVEAQGVLERKIKRLRYVNPIFVT